MLILFLREKKLKKISKMMKKIKKKKSPTLSFVNLNDVLS